MPEKKLRPWVSSTLELAGFALIFGAVYSVWPLVAWLVFGAGLVALGYLLS